MGQKYKRFREFRTPFFLCDIRKNPRRMYARVPQAMAQFVLKIEKIVPYHGANPNARNGARLRSPPPIMAPDSVEKCTDNLVVPILHQAFKHDYDQENYLVLQGNSEIFEFIPGGYATKEETTIS